MASGSKPSSATSGLIVSARSAGFLHVHVGEHVILETATGHVSVPISGIALPQGLLSHLSHQMFVMASARKLRQWFHIKADANMAFVVLFQRSHARTTVHKLQQSLGGLDTVSTLSTLGAQPRNLQILLTILSVVSGLTFVFSGVILFNAMRTAIAQRTREYAIMRSLGVTRRGLFLRIMAEGLMGEVLANIAGFGRGLLIEGLAIKVIGRTLAMTIASPPIDLSSFMVPVGLGIAVVIVATLWPAIQVTHISIIAGLVQGLKPSLPSTVTGIKISVPGICMHFVDIAAHFTVGIVLDNCRIREVVKPHGLDTVDPGLS